MSSTHKLILCNVRNAKGESSVRLVELEAFKLWRYMMKKAHGIDVDNVELGLWMEQHTYHEKEALYSRSGRVEEVDRIVLSIYDARNGFCESIVRFARSHETNRVREVLLSHVADTVKQSGGVEVDIHKGYCLVKISNEQQLNLGLAGDSMTIGLD